MRLVNFIFGITANSQLLISGVIDEKAKTVGFYYVYTSEDPESGAPFALCGGPFNRLTDCAGDAWEKFFASPFVNLVCTSAGSQSFEAALIEDYGWHFTRAIKTMVLDHEPVKDAAYVEYEPVGPGSAGES